MTKAIKGFDKNLQCRGFQFEIGKTYLHDGDVKSCRSGFHVITGNPLAVLEFYHPATGARFCEVEISGATDNDGADKTAAEILTVGAEFGLKELATDAASYIYAKAAKEPTTGDDSPSATTGNRSPSATTGNRSPSAALGINGRASAAGVASCAVALNVGGAVMGEVDGIDLYAREVVWDKKLGKYIRKSHALGVTGEGGIAAGVWYRCVGGRMVPASVQEAQE